MEEEKISILKKKKTSVMANNIQQLEMQEENRPSSCATTYTDIIDNLEDLEDDIKKIYHQTLTLLFDVMCVRTVCANVKRYAEHSKLEVSNNDKENDNNDNDGTK